MKCILNTHYASDKMDMTFAPKEHSFQVAD